MNIISYGWLLLSQIQRVITLNSIGKCSFLFHFYLFDIFIWSRNAVCQKLFTKYFRIFIFLYLSIYLKYIFIVVHWEHRKIYLIFVWLALVYIPYHTIFFLSQLSADINHNIFDDLLQKSFCDFLYYFFLLNFMIFSFIISEPNFPSSFLWCYKCLTRVRYLYA